MFKLTAFFSVAFFFISGEVGCNSSPGGKSAELIARARHYAHIIEETVKSAVININQIAEKTTSDGQKHSAKVQECIDSAKKEFIDENKEYVKSTYLPILDSALMVINTLESDKLSEAERKYLEERFEPVDNQFDEYLEYAGVQLSAHLKEDTVQLKNKFDTCIKTL